mmetsp:Transcript_17033/g.40639  ORF Transcript_17033/g.40639 Transcript_17033/m.40639 type:complete len:348 (+) Transcript_17033:827-1870(+)
MGDRGSDQATTTGTEGGKASQADQGQAAGLGHMFDGDVIDRKLGAVGREGRAGDGADGAGETVGIHVVELLGREGAVGDVVRKVQIARPIRARERGREVGRHAAKHTAQTDQAGYGTQRVARAVGDEAGLEALDREPEAVSRTKDHDAVVQQAQKLGRVVGRAYQAGGTLRQGAAIDQGADKIAGLGARGGRKGIEIHRVAGDSRLVELVTIPKKRSRRSERGGVAVHRILEVDHRAQHACLGADRQGESRRRQRDRGAELFHWTTHFLNRVESGLAGARKALPLTAGVSAKRTADHPACRRTTYGGNRFCGAVSRRQGGTCPASSRGVPGVSLGDIGFTSAARHAA